MGNKPLRNPNTYKTYKDDSNGFINFGLCEMQGWRSTMVTKTNKIQEDASISKLDYNGLFHLFAVFDGHGGQLVAKFVADNYIDILTNLDNFKNDNIEQAMIEVNLKLDELLKNKQVNEILIKKIPKGNGNDLAVNSNHIDLGNLLDNSKEIDISPISVFNKENINLGSPLPTKKERLNFSSEGIHEIDPYSEMIDIDHSKIAANTGTTANIILIKNNIMYFSNIGDSISVMYKNGKAERINLEHKTFLTSESTRIANAGKKIVGDRIEGRINLSRAIGTYIIYIYINYILNFYPIHIYNPLR